MPAGEDGAALRLLYHAALVEAPSLLLLLLLLPAFAAIPRSFPNSPPAGVERLALAALPSSMAGYRVLFVVYIVCCATMLLLCVPLSL